MARRGQPLGKQRSRLVGFLVARIGDRQHRDAQRMEGEAFVDTGQGSAPALAVGMIGFGRLDPFEPAVADLALPEDGFGLEPVHQIIGGVEGCAPVPRGGAREDDRLAGKDLAAAVDDADMGDVEPLSCRDRDVLQRLLRQARMMVENQPVDAGADVDPRGRRRRS